MVLYEHSCNLMYHSFMYFFCGSDEEWRGFVNSFRVSKDEILGSFDQSYLPLIKETKKSIRYLCRYK